MKNIDITNLLEHKLLPYVDKPARYLGNEQNVIHKPLSKVNLRFAIAFPEVYEIAMSSQAITILYHLLNRLDGVWAERVFAPWIDAEEKLRQHKIPLFSLESFSPIGEFDIIGFSLGHELIYTNVLNMLDLAQIPVLASERDDSHPLVIAGGSCTLNPEPMADFIDFFIIGDGEEVLLELLNNFREWKNNRVPKKQLLRQVAAISGIYVPGFYQVEYQADGLLKSVTPTVPELDEEKGAVLLHRLRRTAQFLQTGRLLEGARLITVKLIAALDGRGA